MHDSPQKVEFLCHLSSWEPLNGLDTRVVMTRNGRTVGIALGLDSIGIRRSYMERREDSFTPTSKVSTSSSALFITVEDLSSKS